MLLIQVLLIQVSTIIIFDNLYVQNQSTTTAQALARTKTRMTTWLNSNFRGRWKEVSGPNVTLASNQWMIVMRIGRINVPLMLCLMRQPLYGRSAEYADNRISLFSAQWGKCAVTGRNFVISEDIHCHHKKPRKQGGTDKFENLVLVFESVHRLIHATDNKTIEKYLEKLELNKKQLQKVNEFRTQLELQEIA